MSRPIVYLHVGAPKTGTTFVQHTLWRNRHVLRDRGVLYPGVTPQLHFWSALDLREAPFEARGNPKVANAWPRMVAELRRWGGRAAVVDHESLAGATRKQVERALRDLAFADVHIIYTARDVARQLPAAWQERIKNGSTIRYGEFLDEVRRPRGHPDRLSGFWRLHDPVDVLARWARRLPPDSAHVITVPPSGNPPELLWQRFCSVIGVDSAELPTATDIPNSSLGAVEAATLRAVNEHIHELNVPSQSFVPPLKHVLGPALAQQRSRSIALPDDVYEWALEVGKRTARGVTEAGYDVIGDVGELIPGPNRPGIDPDTVPAADQAEPAMRAIAVLFRELAQRHKRPQMIDRRPPQPVAETKRWLADRAQRGGALGMAYKRYRRVVEGGRNAVRP